MSDEYQIDIPPSFFAVYANTQGRLTAPIVAVRVRYEVCEDLAQHLVEHAQTLYRVQASSESEILARIHAGLATEDSGMAPGEATWIVRRLAELLVWPQYCSISDNKRN